MSWINALEKRFGRFAISGLLTYIAVLSVVVFVSCELINPRFLSYLILDPERVMHGEVWRLVTYMLIPRLSGFLPPWIDVFFYAYFLILIGSALEQEWGAFKLNLYVLLCALGITAAAFWFGAFLSSLIFFQAMFLAFARYYPDMTLYMIVIPVKVRWLAWIDVAYLMWLFLLGPIGFKLGLICAMSCYLIFFGPEIWEEAGRRAEVRTRRQRFERGVKDATAESLHKCAVCGRTDVSSPELDFRVAKDGNEYCTQHLPKVSAELPNRGS